MLNCKCVSSDNIRPLTYHIFLLIWVNAWSWPSSDPNFWLFDVETCPITRFDTHSRWGGGFKCLKKKKKKSLVFNATQLATLHRFVWFISLSLLLFLINFFRWCAKMSCRVSIYCIFLKALKIDRNKNRKDTSDDRHKLAVSLMLRKLKRIGTRER